MDKKHAQQIKQEQNKAKAAAVSVLLCVLPLCVSDVDASHGLLFELRVYALFAGVWSSYVAIAGECAKN